MIKEICDYIINEIIENAEGNQYCVDFDEIVDEFNISLTEDMKEEIIKKLWASEKVADAIKGKTCFDVVLFTKYTD